MTLSVFDQGAYPPCPAPFNLAAHVLTHSERLADKSALVVPGRENMRFSALQAAVRGTGTGLLEAGLRPGDIALMRLGNTVEFPIAYLGAIAVGIIPVPTSSQLTTREVDAMVAELSPAVILQGKGIAGSSGTTPVIPQDQLEQMQTLPPCNWDMGAPERMAYIVYTSGTSGKPRAVCHAHRAIWARGMMIRGWYDLSEHDRLCHAGAFNWTYTLGTGLMDPWSVGATAIIPDAGTTPEALPDILASQKATVFAATPGVYRKILKQHSALDLPNLRHGLSAGEKLSGGLRDQWNTATGRKLFEAYGMSECSTFISASPTTPARPGMLGQPQTGRRVAIVDDNGAPVPLGQDGTIAVSNRDPGLLIGYFGAESELHTRMRGEWFLTGDHGAMEEDGQIAYHARVDDMMNAGGYRVSPLEVEAAFHGFPGLTEIGVTDIEIKQDVRVIAAFYCSEQPLDEDALAQYAASRLARYKTPRIYTRIAAMPTNPNGKIQRQALKSVPRDQS
ncbi:MAG: benzoate--CoA ligase [Rhodobacterales bacterium]|nr:MAG: benzoate--CoA ligase [Rhodobacterales bacterium]